MKAESLAARGADPIELDRSRVHEVKAADLAIRFAFGCGVSMVAGKSSPHHGHGISVSTSNSIGAC